MTVRNVSALSRSRLSAALLSALTLTVAGSAFAQDSGQAATPASSQTENQPTHTLDKVSVTGSRIKRADIEGPAPVTVITADQIEREGFSTVFDALETLSQNTGVTQNELNSAGGFTPNGSPVNLRGLGPGRTLLLINGRRAADYPFPYNGQSNFQNFGNIPSAAVDRIEILAGGASAIYGSDAVAGVVNVILKTNFEGDVFKLRGGTTTEGGGDFGDVQWIGGRTGDNWSLTYAFEYFADEPIFGTQRDFMDSSLDNPRPPAVVGIQPTSTMLLRRNSGSTTGSYLTPRAGACEQLGDEWVRWNFQSRNATTGVITNLGQACGSYKNSAYQTITNGNRDLSGYLYGTFDFDSGLQAWASLSAYHSKSKLTGGTEFISGPHIDGLGVFSNYYDPQFNSSMTIQRLFTPQEVGGLDKLYQRFTEKSFDLAVGLRGTIADRWDWDVTLGRAEYNADRTRPRLDGDKVTSYFFGARQGTQSGLPVYRLNLDRYYTALTPQQFADMSTVVTYDAESYVNQAQFTISGDLFELPAGPLGMAAVVEASEQGYTLNTDERLLPSRREIYNLTGTSGGGDRNRYAAGVEFNVPILSSLTASLSGRWDKYDDITNVDDAKTWGAGLEWRPLENLLFRGSYSTSFKAPDMHYVFNEGSGSFTTTLDYYRCLSSGGTPGQATCNGATYNYSMFATSMGEPTLEEETGKSFTTGVVWDILDDLSISVDYFNIRLYGAVSNLTSAYIIEMEGGCRTGLDRNRQPFKFEAGSAFCQEILGRVTRDPAPGEPTDRVSNIRSGPVNTAYNRVNGIDATINYRFDTDRLGTFNTQLAWTHTLAEEYQQFATDKVDEDYRDYYGNYNFRSRIRGSAAWRKDDWSANLFMVRYGSVPAWGISDARAAKGQSYGRTGPYFVWNANVSKRITDKAKLTLFVNNIFNNFHPKDDTYNSYPYFWRAFSPVGREISAQFEYTFR
ncbi:TonB-dependent receptor plug domain-containing protein [Pseudoxanthomonas sp.]|uniref:TonB-dependent receptor plug domain-containing protein n=1 Tax=Pseudoxanthomonas sp. TaxID=1871049 RepID=UPI003F7D6447